MPGKRILVTGLCLQGNMGGPAIALSLVNLLQEHGLDGATFTFAVPASDLQWERPRAEEYGFEVIGALTVNIGSARKLLNCVRIARKWWKIVLEQDAVIDMTAICYVGPPERPTFESIRDGRFLSFCLCRLAGKPFVAWTQSIGPFSSPIVKMMARLDLGQQKIIYCRGVQSARHVNELLPEAKVEVYPDVACTLGYSTSRGAAILANYGVDLTRPIVTISLSTVMYAKHGEAFLGALHDVVAWLLENDYQVVLVPHVFRHGSASLMNCDYTLSRHFMEQFATAGVRQRALALLTELRADDLKSVIANASFHVGARYHSVIAALSSAVPVLCVSWHHKYRDILQMYGQSGWVWEFDDGVGSLLDMTQRLSEQRCDIAERLRQVQPSMEERIHRNAISFMRNL